MPSLLIKKNQRVVNMKKTAFSYFKYFLCLLETFCWCSHTYHFSFPQLVLCCWCMPDQPGSPTPPSG